MTFEHLSLSITISPKAMIAMKAMATNACNGSDDALIL
jgi:hypothetical protein